MIQLTEEEIENIINCNDPNSVECAIHTTITNMKNAGVIHDMIMCYIQELDISLTLYKSNNLPVARLDNIQFARQILMHKILNGIDA
ncbi:MAG: hypothetical protein V4608_13660 [Bacteroidota bacterium]